MRGAGTLVGRAVELGELERVLAEARAGRAVTALVAGDAGIGKTRLVGELMTRAAAGGFEVLAGRCVDLVGTELPYLPFAAALRRPGPHHAAIPADAASPLQVFEATLAVLTEFALSAPVLLVLEDVHWADPSTLDLLTYLAHALERRRVLVVATYRADEVGSAERMRRLAGGVLRSGAAVRVDLGPLSRSEVEQLVAARTDGTVPYGLALAIADRSEGNPFFAEELLTLARASGRDLPRSLHDVLLQRMDRLGRPTRELLRVAAIAGRDVTSAQLSAVSGLTERESREPLREAVEQRILLVDARSGSYRFRHALLADAVYATLLPGEREELHAAFAEHLAAIGSTSPAELAPHWAAAGRVGEAFVASVAAAREAQAVAGLAETLAHLERAIELWPLVPDAARQAGGDLATVCARAAELAGHTGGAQRAVELARRAIELVGPGDPARAGSLHVLLGEYLLEIGRTGAGYLAFQRAVDLSPSDPPTPGRAFALGSLAGALMLQGRYEASMRVAEEALAMAERLDAGAGLVRALTVLGTDLAYLGRGAAGLDRLHEALRLAEDVGDLLGLERVYVNLTDALFMLARGREAAEVAQVGLEAMRRRTIHSTLLLANRLEALLAIGDWEEADQLSSRALSTMTPSFPDVLLILRAELETGRGDLDDARRHLDAAREALRDDHAQGFYELRLAGLALWERRWTDADRAVGDGLALAGLEHAAQMRVRLCATGLRAQAELAALARARRDDDGVRRWRARAAWLLAEAERAAGRVSTITPAVDGWLLLARAEHSRAGGTPVPEFWTEAAATWERLEHPALAAYCAWREAEALVARGAPRAQAVRPLRRAHAVGVRLGARPLLTELEALARRARLDPTQPAVPAVGAEDVGRALGLTRREAEVLSLVARGCTNRQIAVELTISHKTASVHVAHILAKLDVANRQEAAAVALRVGLLEAE